MINELKEILKKEAEQKGDMKKVKEIEKATTFYHLGYSFQDAIKKLKEANVPIVMTQDEKTRRRIEDRMARGIIEEGVNNAWAYQNGLTNGRVNLKDFESTSDFIMVHKTNYAPKNGRIESNMSAGAKVDLKITLGGEEYKGTQKKPRNTVHFATNHEVLENDGGEWGEKKYAVLIPFDDLKKQGHIVSAKYDDTYNNGPVVLTENSYILCPKEEIATIQKDNPGVTVIGYEGELVQGYANTLISLLGYRYEPAGGLSLKSQNEATHDNEQADKFLEIMEKEGLERVQHSTSEEALEELRMSEVFCDVGILDLIGREKLIDKFGKERLIEYIPTLRTINDVGYEESRKLCAYFGVNEDKTKWLINELKEIGINISFDEYQKVFESHVSYIDERGHKNLDTPYEDIRLSYLLDAVAERDKRLMAENAEEGEIETETKSIVEDETNTDQTSESEETNNEEEETEEQVEEDGNSGSKKEEDDEDGWSM